MSLDLVVQGFTDVISLHNLLYLAVGVSLGTLVGLLPGIGPATGVALLLPLTISMDPLSALIMLAGLYYGTQYGGSITSVLINTPGEGSQVFTALEGHKLAKRGRAGAALGISALASFVGGVLTLPILIVALPSLSWVALEFGPPEFFALVVLALTGIGSLGGKASRIKGLAMAVAGVALATVGMNPVTGGERFTFGITELYGGILLVPALIGLFAIGESAMQVGMPAVKPIRARFRDMAVTREELRRSGMPAVRGSIIGFLVGVFPGVGVAVASFLSYDIERRVSKRRDEFGEGSIGAVSAIESSNNAAVNGAFLPTLTLGIPGSAATAVLVGALLVHGIRPGPAFVTEQPELAWGLVASFALGNLMLLVMNFPLAPVWALLLRLRYELILPVVVVVSLLGAFAMENSMIGIWTAVVFGVLAILMRVGGLPVVPLLIGLLLGGMLESSLLQTSAMAFGDLTILFKRPIAATMLALTVVLLLWGPAKRMVMTRWRQADREEVPATR